jgi:hypothetical protein
MISGYCQCSYPAIHVCAKCGKKFCNNCFKNHKCEAPEPKAPAREVAPAAVQSYEKKPGKPTKTK